MHPPLSSCITVHTELICRRQSAYNTATAVSVTVGGKTALVYGAALASGFVGLYQVAIQIPTSLTDGDYPVIASISDVQSPATTLITVQQ